MVMLAHCCILREIVVSVMNDYQESVFAEFFSLACGLPLFNLTVTYPHLEVYFPVQYHHITRAILAQKGHSKESSQ